MINRQLVHYDTAGQRVIIQPGDLTNVGGDVYAISPGGAVTSVADVPNTIPIRDADGGFEVGYLQVDTTPPVVETPDVGKLIWNDTDGTIDFELKGGNVSIPIGEKEVIRCRNADVAPMVAGQVVYLSGSSGSHKEIKLANASSESTSDTTIGVVAEPIAINQEGFVVTTGLIRDINTITLTQGAPIWLSTVSGQMTTTRPIAPNHGVLVGFCVRQHAAVGVVYIKIDNGWELDELHNVYISGVANNDVLMYNSVNSRWQNVPTASQPWVLKAGDTMTGSLALSYSEVIQYLNSTNTTLGAYLILRSNGTNIGAFQAGGTAMVAPFTDQMRIRAYRPAGGIDFAVAGSATATHRMDASSNFMVAGSAWFGKAIAPTYTDTFGRCEVYYGAATGGVKCGIAAIDTTSQAIGQGGGILFGGAFNGTTVTTAGVIRSSKTNSTNGNYSFGMDFYTRENGSANLTRAIAITDTGRVGIGVSPATAMIHIKAGTATASTAPLKFTSGTLLSTAEAGAVEFNTDKAYLTITTGASRKEIALADSALTAGQQPTTTTNGRLVNSNKFSIYATGTTNGVAGSSVNLTLLTLPNNGDLRFVRITVKAMSASAPPDIYGRTLNAMWGNAAGVLTQVGADELGTTMAINNLAAATITTSAAGTTLRVTCTDVTGCGSTVTWSVYGEYY